MISSPLPQYGTLYQYKPQSAASTGLLSSVSARQRIHFCINLVLLLMVWFLLNTFDISLAQSTSSESTLETPVKATSAPTAQQITPTPTPTSLFIWPVSGSISTSFSDVHNGIDIIKPSDSNIMAAGDGIIEFSGCRDNGYGCYIIINHQNGYRTLYAHMAFLFKQEGEPVKQGEVIGLVGATGNATTTHLHFAVLENDLHIDPLTVLP